VLSYAVDAGTGRLRFVAEQIVGDAHTIAGEPQGRYVYAAFGPRSAGPPYDEPKPSIVAYGRDASSGRLVRLSEASSDPMWHSSQPVKSNWYSLSASATRVYAMWATATYHDVYNTLVMHAVGSEGRLGPVNYHEFFEEYPSGVAVDVESDVFYKAGESAGLTAYSAQPDGSLTPVGESSLCAAASFSTIAPLVGVRGIVFAYGLSDRTTTTCSWQGPSLAPHSNLGMRAGHAVAQSAGARTLVAMRMETPPTGLPQPPWQYEIRLFAMSDDGNLALLDSVTGPGYAERLLFHPSGRFLYVSNSSSPGASLASLNVYAIDAQGHLALVQSVPDGGGAMAVTLLPS
jgi:hypothetical protein